MSAGEPSQAAAKSAAMVPRLWLAALTSCAAPALWQLLCLARAFAGRVLYPFDLEWMEGGLLVHALRLRDGAPLYAPPSVDFIPYLYTPLYPGVLALIGDIVPVSYALGRGISIAAIVGLFAVAAWSLVRWPALLEPARSALQRAATFVGGATAIGLFCAAYPIVEGWYDIVRADSLMLLMVTAPLAALPPLARRVGRAPGLRAHAGVAALSALLALAFFAKQTAVFYVAAGGAIVLVIAPRKLATFVLVAGVIGLGGVALLSWLSDGWFWTYASKIHRAHDFSWDRFARSFGNILWRPHLPGAAPYPALGAAMSLTILAALAAVALAWRRARQVPRGAWPFLLWAPVFGLSTIIGAIGWGTEFAHFNAYMPAFLHGALATGAAIGAICASAEACWGARRAAVPTVAVVAALAAALWMSRWAPQRFTPTAADRAAGERLLSRLRALPGEVWMPSHPYYLVLAGKRPFVHRMGVKDVTWRQDRQVAGLAEALAARRFSALVLDSRDVHLEIPEVPAAYYRARELPDDERPRLRTGALVVPDSVWMPSAAP